MVIVVVVATVFCFQVRFQPSFADFFCCSFVLLLFLFVLVYFGPSLCVFVSLSVLVPFLLLGGEKKGGWEVGESGEKNGG